MGISFGFRGGRSSVHTARTMMLAELEGLLEAVPAGAGPAEYRAAVLDANVLGKRTASNRLRTLRPLSELYALDPSVTLFRVLRRLWDLDPPGRPLLALLCASARDVLLLASAPTVLHAAPGEPLSKTEIERDLAPLVAGRLNAAILYKVAQNAASSWTQAGFLSGKVNKVRRRPVVTDGAVVYALTLGYLQGARGRALLETTWARLLDSPTHVLLEHALAASRRGWIEVKVLGEVVDVDVSALLTGPERKALRGSD